MSRLMMIFLLALGIADAEQQCELLKTTLTYSQEEAPTDLSGVLPVVVERINRELEGVVDVEVEWKGADLQGHVGDHIIQCKVTRLASVISKDSAGGNSVMSETFTDDDGHLVASQCFHIPFRIQDTNECALPEGHKLRHKCDDSAICVNTIGSYECLCPRLDGSDEVMRRQTISDDVYWEELNRQKRGPWEISYKGLSQTSCPSSPSTHGCCPVRVHSKAGEAGAKCRSNFKCPVDPCSNASLNDCSASAKCMRKVTPTRSNSDRKEYTCKCPDGLMGNGLKCLASDPIPEPKVMYDGVTPTDETVKNNLYCDCTLPIIDACSGFPTCKDKHEECVVGQDNQPRCACKKGYVHHEIYGCVDEEPPLLRLKNDPDGDQITRLKQGDRYKEYAVEIEDENAEEYLRSLKIAYSQPLPYSCLTKIGQFHVNYTIATPWTSPPFVRITRRVVIDDIDECSIAPSNYEKDCPELIPHCDTKSGAKCVNTIGSYTCKCPEHTAGDGFDPAFDYTGTSPPEGYKGGQGCVDNSVPVINIQGPNPKVFRVAECGGISSIMGNKASDKMKLKSSQRGFYANDIKNLITATAGAELCATHVNRNPDPSDCVQAYDMTHHGRVDLSKKVVVGDPVQKSNLLWSVPYDVKDEAGNAAVTVWRDIAVEEVNLAELESKIRDEIIHHQKFEVDKAVQRALEEERKKKGTAASPRSRKDKTCPACPKCECSGNTQINEASCAHICRSKMESCAIEEESYVIRTMLWLEKFIPPSVVPVVMMCTVFIVLFFVVRVVFTFLFNPNIYNRPRYYPEEEARRLHDSVTYYQSEMDGMGARPVLPPRASMSMGSDRGFFTPQQVGSNGSNGGVGRPFGFSPGYNGDAAQRQDRGSDDFDIYESPVSPASGIITPSKRGDGVGGRPPYSASRS